MINANDYRCVTDSETLEAAIAARTADGIIVIPPRVSDIEPERTYWLIDRAILLPENTTLPSHTSCLRTGCSPASSEP